MMLDAFFVALAVFVGVAGHELLGMAMLSRPIVVAPLAGLLLGDVQTGLIVGASLESIFMGVVNIGISSTAEPALAAGLCNCFLQFNLGGKCRNHYSNRFSHWQCFGFTVNELYFLFCDWSMRNRNLKNLQKKEKIKKLQYFILVYGSYIMRYMH